MSFYIPLCLCPFPSLFLPLHLFLPCSLSLSLDLPLSLTLYHALSPSLSPSLSLTLFVTLSRSPSLSPLVHSSVHVSLHSCVYIVSWFLIGIDCFRLLLSDLLEFFACFLRSSRNYFSLITFFPDPCSFVCLPVSFTSLSLHMFSLCRSAVSLTGPRLLPVSLSVSFCCSASGCHALFMCLTSLSHVEATASSSCIDMPD